MDSKACKHCDEVKPLESFYRWTRSKDGRADWCKACRSSHDKSVAPQTKVRFTKWYHANKPQHQAGNKRWIAKNRAKHNTYQKVYGHRRRCTMLCSTYTPLTVAQWQETLLVFNHACAYCLRQGVPLEQEHMMPISRGGAHSADNVVPACRSCNASKATRSLLEFIHPSLATHAVAA